MRKIAIALSKGGVGKTTTAVSLSAGLATVGKRVLLVDADVQGQCATMLGLEPKNGLAELLMEDPDPTEVLTEARPDLWLLAGGFSLSKAKQMMARENYRSDLILSKVMKPYEGHFDYVIVDTAPSFDNLTVNVLCYIDEIICPVNMEALALDGLGTFLENIKPIQEEEGITLRYILPTFLDGRVKKTEEVLDQLYMHFPDKLCRPIHYSVKLSEAPAWGKTIYEYSPKDRAAVDYSILAGELERG